MTSNQESIVHIVVFVSMIIFVWVFYSKIQSNLFNRLTGSQTSTIEAMFLQLVVISEINPRIYSKTAQIKPKRKSIKVSTIVNAVRKEVERKGRWITFSEIPLHGMGINIQDKIKILDHLVSEYWLVRRVHNKKNLYTSGVRQPKDEVVYYD